MSKGPPLVILGVVLCPMQKFTILVRDIYAYYPLLIKYVDLHRSHWLKNPAAEAEELFSCVAEIFTMWTKSLVGWVTAQCLHSVSLFFLFFFVFVYCLRSNLSLFSPLLPHKVWWWGWGYWNHHVHLSICPFVCLSVCLCVGFVQKCVWCEGWGYWNHHIRLSICP